jgi:hypothetical protein
VPRIAHILRSRHGVLAVLSVIALVGAVSYRVYDWRFSDTPTIANTEHNTDLLAQTTGDSDGDGYLDWQEFLVGTDPYDAVSIPSPTVSLYDILAVQEQASTSPGSITAAHVSKTLLDNYFNLKDMGSYSADIVDTLGASMALQVDAQPDFVPYTAADLSTIDSSTAARTAYERDMKQATKPLLARTRPEIELIALMIRGRDQSAGAELARLADRYAATARAMYRVTVPKDAVAVHLQSVNALAYYGSVLEAIVAYKDDSLSSLVLLQDYNSAEAALLESFAQLGSYYRGVTASL